MATQLDPGELDLQEQLAKIRQMMDASDRDRAETRKLSAETRVISASIVLQAMLATAALLGAGAAIAKLFFPG
ncbi:MAG: hypothetical protein LBV50_05720 [Novosphingobium sp.]|jgi:hypothetical protein|nr:hypothetical protein [Novosphingobium sp.]